MALDQLSLSTLEGLLSQECRDTISTLPMEKSWVVGDLYQYQGFWYNPFQLHGVLSCQKHFQAQDNDIILVTTPKSGTTWLKALTFALVNRKKYPSTQERNHPLLTNNPHVLVPFIELNLFNVKDITLDDPNSLSPSPGLFSSHCPYVSLPKSMKESNCKIVYLCRDPKDTFVSMWHFLKKLRPENSQEECFDQFCGGVSLCGPFWEHVLGYWKESLERPEKIMFLRYEDLKMKPALVLKELGEFIGCPFSNEEKDPGVVDDILKLCSFDNLSNLEVNKAGRLPYGVEHKSFFHRGEIGDWKNLLTIEMVEQMSAIAEKKLGEHGLNF